MGRLFRKLLHLLRSSRHDADLRDEMETHRALRQDALERGGLAPAEAARASRRALGNVALAAEDARDIWAIRAVDSLRQDLRYAWRLSWRHPGFTIAAVLTLALGIGANGAIFSLVDAVLLRTLPVNQPEGLVLIEQAMARGGTQNISRPLFEELREERRVFSGVFAAQDGLTDVKIGIATAATQPAGASNDATGAEDRSQTAGVQSVSGEYFQVLGTSAFMGRTFTPDDDRTPGAHPVTVLSHAFWTQKLGADPTIVGRAIALNGQSFTIVGIARPGFFGDAVGRAPDVWVPMMMYPALTGRSYISDPRVGWLTVIGRLQPGVTRAQAETALGLFLDRLRADPAALDGMPSHIGTLRVTDGSQGQTRLQEQFSWPLRILSGAVALVLLIVCANLATLLLARANTRQREMAVRLAIGAPRRRIVRQLVTESVLLAMIGGSLGLLFSWWGSRALVAMAGTLGQRIDVDVTPDARVLAFTAIVSLGAVMLFGLAPALSASRTDVHAAMKPGAGTRSNHRLSTLLVVAQIALALPMIAGAALLLQTLHNLRTRDLGFATDALIQVRTRSQAGEIPGLSRRVVERLSAMPGVLAAANAQSGFATGTSSTCCIAIPGRVFASEREREVRMIGVGPGYFATVGQRLRAGRDFAVRDLGPNPFVPGTAAIVNEAFIKAFLEPGNPIGQRFGWGDPPKARYDIEVVGVVNDVVYDEVRGTGRPLIYFPSETGRLYVVRAAGPAAGLTNVLRHEIQAVDPRLIVTDISRVAEDIERALVRETLLARLSGMFGVLAVALAAIGLYGLLAYAVTSRTRDIGIQMALGAPRDRVLRSEVRSALRLAAIGIAIGVPLAFAASHLIAAQLFGVSAGDPITLVAASALVIVVAALAAYGPARRASRINPIVALGAQ